MTREGGGPPLQAAPPWSLGLSPLLRDLSWSERCSVLVLVTSSTLLALYTCRDKTQGQGQPWGHHGLPAPRPTRRTLAS